MARRIRLCHASWARCSQNDGSTFLADKPSTDFRALLTLGQGAPPYIDHATVALSARISEVMEEPHACAVNTIVHAALNHVRDAEAQRTALFRLAHPDRERFDREGWRAMR